MFGLSDCGLLLAIQDLIRFINAMFLQLYLNGAIRNDIGLIVP